MRTYASFLLNDLLPLVGHGQNKLTLPTPHDGEFTVPVNSSRLECLHRNHSCVTCGKEGALWLLQSHTTEHPHLNLYAVQPMHGEDDELILMTQDHRVPRSRGGKTTQDNLQTMCSYCNNKKGSSSQEEFLLNKELSKEHVVSGKNTRIQRYCPPAMFTRSSLFHGK